MFDFNRFWLLVRRQAVENYKFYLLAIGLMAGLLAAYYSLFFRVLHEPEIRASAFMLSLYLAGTVFTNILVRELHAKTAAIWYLMLPASVLEKLSTVLFYSVLLFVPIHLLVFYGVEASFVSMHNARFSPEREVRLLDLGIDEASGGLFYTGFLVLQAVALLGSLYFTRYSYVKTVVVVSLCLILVFYSNGVLLGLLVSAEVKNPVPFYGFSVLSGEGFDMESTKAVLPEGLQAVVRFAGQYLLIPFLLVTAFFRLKEKEV
ncbi:MAG: hypothetical protein MUD08_00675 [Cytophagales bacterium]|jgi:hypothetical protein|nr:hypothetical protein [Cytophagales bacterium]